MYWARADILRIGLVKVLLITAVIVLMSVAPAGAGAAKPKKDDGHGGHGSHDSHGAEEEAVAPLDPHLVFMPALAVPVVEQGELLFYYYVGIQLRVTKVGKVPTVKEQVPLIQDAFVRYVHRHPLNAYQGEGEIDRQALVGALMPKVQAIIGPELVEEVIVEDVVRSVI